MRETKLETDPVVLDRLSYDMSYWVRVYVADNPNTSPETLERLFYDGCYGVRSLVAENPNTPQYIKDLFKFKNI